MREDKQRAEAIIQGKTVDVPPPPPPPTTTTTPLETYNQNSKLIKKKEVSQNK